MIRLVLYLVTIFNLVIFSAGCSGNLKNSESKTIKNMEANPKSDSITKEEALKIAHENASKYYRDLSIYKIEAVYKQGKWHVDYLLKDPGMVGGGPHYTISAKTGEIESYRFEQ
jgi:hypothetical protein